MNNVQDKINFIEDVSTLFQMKSDEAKYIILYELECNKYTNKQTDFMSFIQNMNILITIFRIKKN